ncbi:hypothetical protein BH11BAC3_BH11BAC3_25460 [soil metagenome]
MKVLIVAIRFLKFIAQGYEKKGRLLYSLRIKMCYNTID